MLGYKYHQHLSVDELNRSNIGTYFSLVLHVCGGMAAVLLWDPVAFVWNMPISGRRKREGGGPGAVFSVSDSEVTCVHSPYILLAKASHMAEPKVSGVTNTILI